MKNLFRGTAFVVLLAGCSTFTTTQNDTSYDEQGAPLRTIASKTTARTIFDSKSALNNFAVLQTDRTQSSKVGSLNQEAAATNAVHMLNALSALVGALPK